LSLPAKSFVCASLLALALLAAVAQPPPAAAATPCWKTLLNDWYDGRIDGTYQVHCYRDAIKHLPADVSTYSSARDDILRALQSARAKLIKAGKKVGPNTLIRPLKSVPGRKTGKGLAGAAKQLNPSSASSVPVPLLVLGSLGILLVLAGGAGLVVKRVQARKPGH